ncbi:hypothetical protein AAG747_28845 [Rapidithrix thailandica]|uniref:Uncharacterized protein n=1 Tax=Rapidithrix thailandica TaxID=413964 RepID=A0AAW9S6R0_9BACT
MKRIFNTHPNGNEASDLEPARYINLAISQINEICEWLKNTNEVAQAMLLHMDILIVLTNKYPDMVDMLMDEDIEEWKISFYDWYERLESKIPKKFREGIKESADQLFSDLDALANES